MSDLTDKRKNCLPFLEKDLPKQNKAKLDVDTNKRGYIIMKALLDEGFNKEQIVGICSCLFQESSWNPTLINTTGPQKCGGVKLNGTGAGGLCQWLPGCNGKHRQKRAVMEINEKYGTSYKVSDYNYEKNKWYNYFGEIPLECQIWFFIYETQNVAPYNNIYKELKSSQNAIEACGIMVEKYERPGKASIENKEHWRHIDLSREVFERYFDDNGNPKKS